MIQISQDNKDLTRLKTKRAEYEDMLFPHTGLEDISEMH